MSDSQATPQKPDTATKSKRGAIILLVTAVVVVAVVLTHFTAFANKGKISANGTSSISQAQPFATATPVPSSSNQSPSGNAVGGATPYPTAITSGYPRPDQDNATEQSLRKQIGNPNKVIIISLYGQYLQAWDHGNLVKWTYVTTGKSGLDTPTGVFHVITKRSPVDFIPGSNDPSSPYFGYLSHTLYGLEFALGGFFIHDAWWRTTYGPGLTEPHWDPGRLEWLDGSHGCVNTPLDAMVWLFQWAEVNMPVIIY